MRKRRMRLLLFGIIALTLFLTACGPLLGPTFINHPRPDLTVDFALFESAGCEGASGRELVCAAESPIAALGCDAIQKPSDLLGGLTPGRPLALCLVSPGRFDQDFGRSNEIADSGEYIYREGGFIVTYYRYVVHDGQDYVLLATKTAVRDYFAPIESADEALSYALAVTSAGARYDLTFDSDLEYFVDEIEDTHVETVTDGYVVHLFRTPTFGCGPFETRALAYKVTADGEFNEESRVEVFKNPDDDNLCVD